VRSRVAVHSAVASEPDTTERRQLRMCWATQIRRVYEVDCQGRRNDAHRRNHHRAKRHHEDLAHLAKVAAATAMEGAGPGPPSHPTPAQHPGRRPLPPSTEPSTTSWCDHQTGRRLPEQGHVAARTPAMQRLPPPPCVRTRETAWTFREHRARMVHEQTKSREKGRISHAVEQDATCFSHPRLIVRAEIRKGQVKQKNETSGADPAPPMSGVRIEIGIGAKPEAGYLHCDIAYRPGVDCICDAAHLPFADHVASRVFNRHLLEHLDAETAAQAVREWHRVLRLGGVLDINVPDLAAHCIQLARPGSSRYLLRTYRTLVSNHEHALRSIFGWQQDQHHYHSWGYTADSLCRSLGQAGFCDIIRIDDGMFCNIRFVARKGTGDSTYRDRRPLPMRLRGAWNDFLALVLAKLTF